MSVEAFTFYVFASMAVVAALVVLFSRKVLYCAFALLVSLLSIAAVYVFANADFLAVSQIVIYVGGVLVLLIFAIMYTHRSHEMLAQRTMRNVLPGLLMGIGCGVGLIYLIISEDKLASWARPTETINTSTVQPIGTLLMTHYVLVFEMTAILLLAALVGATFLAGKGEK